MSSPRLYRRFLIAFVGLSWVLDGAALRSDWRDFIDRDLYKKYLGKAGSQFNRSLFQGDIDKVDRDVSGQEVAMAFNVIKDAKYRWHDAVVPFTISDTFSDDEKMRIRDAITAITELTEDCVRFVERTTEVDYIKIVRGVSCFSSIGRQGGAQQVAFTVGCFEEKGDIQHEILHALGFYHEHTREDRDQYVTINWRNIREDDKTQFQKFDGLTFNLPYDYSSVMHYPWNAFPMNPNLPTMIPNEKLAKIGQRTNLSPLDVQRIRKAYVCDDAADKTINPANIFETKTSTTTIATTQMPSQKDAHIQTMRPKLAELTLPDFNKASLSDVDCKALNTGNCFVESWANCPTGYFSFRCNVSSTESEMRTHLEKIKRTIPSSPITFIIGGKTDLEPETFQSVSDNIVAVSIFWTDGFNCDSLAKLPLPNLLELYFYQSTNITLNRESLRPFQKLRSLEFGKSTIRFLEKGSLESLGSLKTVAFDYSISMPFSLDQWSYLWRLHCSAEYSWLRDYLLQHPQLIQPRKEGEIYSLPGVENVEWTRRNLSYPVDCSRDDLTGDQNQVEFSLNVGRTMAKPPPNIILPDFRKGSLSDLKCNAMNTENCYVKSWAKCSDGWFAFECNESSTDIEIRDYLEKIKRTIPSGPFQFGISGKTEVEPETFQSVSDNIISFNISSIDGFSCDVLRDLPLPNLLELDFYRSTNIIVNRLSLGSFQKMRVLEFKKSTIRFLEKGSLESLGSLKIIALDQEIALPFSLDERSYLWRIHCSGEYFWLREYLDQHAQLIQPRKSGEIYLLPGVENDEWTRRDLFYPVDCSRDDLTGNQNQVKFSLNDQKP